MDTVTNRELNSLTDITDCIYDTIMKNTNLPAFPADDLTSHWVSSGLGYIRVEFGHIKYDIQISKA